jgi:hypothetical protein
VLPHLGLGLGFHPGQGFGHFGVGDHLGIELRVVELLAGQVGVLRQKRHPLLSGEHGGYTFKIDFAVGCLVGREIAQLKGLAGLGKGERGNQKQKRAVPLRAIVNGKHKEKLI